jgi:hypothetical protein
MTFSDEEVMGIFSFCAVEKKQEINSTKMIKKVFLIFFIE